MDSKVWCLADGTGGGHWVEKVGVDGRCSGCQRKAGEAARAAVERVQAMRKEGAK